MIHDKAIDARRVRKVFGKGNLAFEALKGVDFSVGHGEFDFERIAFGPHTWRLDGLLQAHAVIDQVDQRLHRAGEYTFTAGQTERINQHVMLIPYKGLKDPIVLTAWTHMQRFQTIDEAGMRHFIDMYRGIDHHKGAQG